MKFKDVSDALMSGNLSKMIEVMKHHKDFPLPISGINQDGENLIISINPHNITIQTCQHNDWLRTNVYYDDGTTEELYEK